MKLTELKKLATKHKIKGRSKMKRDELERVLAPYLNTKSKKSRKPRAKKSRKPRAKKSRKPVKQSKKSRVRRKTVAEWRVECKKKGLVYDSKTKRCRQSKRKPSKKSIKTKIKKSRKPTSRPTSGMCASGNKILAGYKKWEDKLDKSIKSRGTLLTEKYEKPMSSKPIIDPRTKKIVVVKNIPDDSLSASSWTPYIDDGKLDDDYKNDKFYKLSTCQKTCTNHGVFAQTDLNSLLGMASAKAATCPFCSEAFKLKSEKKRPPYGTMRVSKTGKFFEIEFNMKSGASDGKSYKSRNQWAYLPISKEGKLGLWLMIDGFKKGLLFTIGRSVTTGRFGIVFGGIHMKTNTGGGLTNHGYGRNPVKDMKDVVLQSMINEGNAVGVFTPSQLADFACEEEKHKNKFRMLSSIQDIMLSLFNTRQERDNRQEENKKECPDCDCNPLNKLEEYNSEETKLKMETYTSLNRLKLLKPGGFEHENEKTKYHRDLKRLTEVLRELNSLKQESFKLNRKWQDKHCDRGCYCGKKPCCKPYKCVELNNKNHCLHPDQIDQINQEEQSELNKAYKLPPYFTRNERLKKLYIQDNHGK
jgi:hypothetical protein